MSREVILKYLTEFNAWVKGQEVYVMFSNGEHRLVDSLEDFNEDVKYIVLKDSYFFYRKALCDGKTVQAYYKFNDTWNDIIKPEFKDNVSNYRIKPEEPKFKIGDFVKTPTSIAIVMEHNGQLFAHNGQLFASNNYELQDCTKWKPSHKELCYFTNDTNTKTSATLREFREISKDGFYVDCFGSRFIYCEPFLNSKPSWFKD